MYNAGQTAMVCHKIGSTRRVSAQVSFLLLQRSRSVSLVGVLLFCAIQVGVKSQLNAPLSSRLGTVGKELFRWLATAAAMFLPSAMHMPGSIECCCEDGVHSIAVVVAL